MSNMEIMKIHVLEQHENLLEWLMRPKLMMKIFNRKFEITVKPIAKNREKQIEQREYNPLNAHIVPTQQIIWTKT